jgi:hypothetical protein
LPDIIEFFKSKFTKYVFLNGLKTQEFTGVLFKAGIPVVDYNEY